jgi:hypothetical protein
MKNKNFKAVEFLRKRREELSKKYIENPREAEKNLKLINEKYRIGTSKRKSRIIINK